MTAQTATSIPRPATSRRRPEIPAAALRYVRFSGLFIIAAMVVLIEASGRPPALDPALLLPVVVLAATAIGGLVGGTVTGVVGAMYLVLYYSQPSEAAIAGGWGRVVVSLIATVVAGYAALCIERTSLTQRRAAAATMQRNLDVAVFARRLANETGEKMLSVVVDGSSQLLGADMVVLTVLDPPSGRHFVRAVHGGSGAAVGVEVTPGVGITGQAIRDHRVVVATADPTSLTGLKRRLDGGSGAHSMAAVADVQNERVIASVTVGRGDGTPFNADDQVVLEQIGALATLAIAGSLARSDSEAGAPADALTGLYNRAYLEASLEQLTALRRRTSPENRPPLAMIVFNVDGFGEMNERHGPQAGDQLLRAIATLLRQRFRTSDILARSGGDSFYVVLIGATKELAEDAAAQIRRKVRDLKLADDRGEPFGATVSAGCVALRDTDKPEVMIKSADAALQATRWSGSS